MHPTLTESTQDSQAALATTPAPQELSLDQAATVAGGPQVQNDGA